ncbi:Six-hairpin glycosidase [Guyanagaster necrorhizus]|uniref:Six-hairpin glycosidase n=1 Tax=Guyanagaster necrorhizus TaxID=856835 RepID=A0A9P7VXV3_9AGAR|nr:Six-hairpin glycosidase [Guyanagaster necrorhizus MCA 3950]KAG7448944.1 Six-hairpin glycosidase [Guyanagaster necrorhizus MCA 3950]
MAPYCRLVAAALALSTNVTNQNYDPFVGGIDNDTLSLVLNNMVQVSTKSWELGTATEALLEYLYSEFSVFNSSAFPPGHTLNTTYNDSKVLDIATEVVRAKSNTSMTLVEDTAVGDPASLGVSVLLANWTRTNESDTSFSTAASEELDYLLNYAPRSDSGAISHRSDQVQLWADFIYMAPPFIAYYGALEGGDSGVQLIQTAYEQISLYRDVLRDDSGLWKHVLLGTWNDTTHWATGNAWAAAGMLRVLVTMNHTAQADEFTGQSANLTSWIGEILSAAWEYQADNGTLRNVIDDESTFPDSSSTALLAAVTYRMAAFNNDSSLIPKADKAFELIKGNIDDEGWLQDTVDPYTFTTATAADGYSPEGQSFVILLAAAWRDYILFNSTSSDDS